MRRTDDDILARVRALWEQARQAELNPPPVSRTSRYRPKRRRRWKQNASSQHVGRLLAKFLTDWGITDREAARRCQVAQSTITRVINAQRNVSYEKARQIVAALRIDAALRTLPDGSTPVWAVANSPPRRQATAVSQSSSGT